MMLNAEEFCFHKPETSTLLARCLVLEAIILRVASNDVV